MKIQQCWFFGGALGAPGPRCRICVVHVTTYCQASYLLSGKLPTVRQAFSRYETSYLLSGNLPTVRQAFSRYETSYLQSGRLSAVMKQATYGQAGFQPLWNKLPTVRQATYCQASYLLSGKPSAVWNLHPTSAYMHPNVSIYFAPNNRIHAPIYINRLINII